MNANMNDDWLFEQLNRFLARRTMPRALEGKPQAQEDEMSSLMKVVRRFAPRDDVGEWWAKVEANLEQQGQTRSWPHAGEISSAAKPLVAARRSQIAEQGDFDPLMIAARKIERKEPVGDCYLYGRAAAEMIERGMVTDAQLRPLRSALYFAMKDAWGEDKAKQIEGEMIARYDSMKAALPQIGRQRAAMAAPKRMYQAAAE